MGLRPHAQWKEAACDQKKGQGKQTPCRVPAKAQQIAQQWLESGRSSWCVRCCQVKDLEISRMKRDMAAHQNGGFTVLDLLFDQVQHHGSGRSIQSVQWLVQHPECGLVEEQASQCQTSTFTL